MSTVHPGDNDRATVESRDLEAVTLRLSGLSYQAVADRIGYTNKGTAHAAVMRALAMVRNEKAEELRNLEASRLDRVQQAIWPQVLQGSPRHVEAFIRLSARRCAMLGLDAPKAIAVSGALRADAADALAALRLTVLGEVTDVHDEPA